MSIFKYSINKQIIYNYARVGLGGHILAKIPESRSKHSNKAVISLIETVEHWSIAHSVEQV